MEFINPKTNKQAETNKMIMRFFKKHIWLLVAFFAIVLFPQSLSLQSKLDGRIIITGLAIDKAENGFLVTAQTISPSSGSTINGGQAEISFFSAQSTTIHEGIKKIAAETGKEAGIAHLNYIVLGSSLFDLDLANILDFVVREEHTDTTVLLLVADNAKEEIKKVKNLELGTAVAMRKTFLTKQNQSNGLLMIANQFISNKFNPSCSSIISYLEIENGEQEQNSDVNSKEGQSSEQSNTNVKKGRIKYMSPIALFRNGYYKGKLQTADEVAGFHFANKHAKQLVWGFENINYKNAEGCKITFQSKKKKVSMKITITDDKPHINMNVTLSNNSILEIILSNNDTLWTYETQKTYLPKEVRSQLEEQIKSNIIKTFQTCKNYGIDIFNSCNKLEQFNKTQFDAYFKNHNLDQYLNDAIFDVNVKIDTATT